MIVPKKHRIMVYYYLFKEGVMVAKKDFYKAKHEDVSTEDLHVPNIQVMHLMKSLVSRGYVKQTFNW